MLRVAFGGLATTCGGLAGLQTTRNLKAETVMDVCFDSALSAEKTAAMLRDPTTAVAIGNEIGARNVASIGLDKPQWIADDYTAMKVGSLTFSNMTTTSNNKGQYIHTYHATKTSTDGRNNPIFTVDVEYTMTPGGWWPGGCTIHRRVTNFEQTRHVLVPWLSLLKFYWLDLENRAFQSVLRKRLY